MITAIEDIEYLRRYANRLMGRKDVDDDPEISSYILKVDSVLSDFAGFLTEDELKKRYPPLVVKDMIREERLHFDD